jgi:DNA polymerase IV (DinB-like DNA polymerase)
MDRRIILHLDMDYFFAAVEERENPALRGQPVVVGADPKGGKGRGVVSTCNYEARKFGIHSGMPISIAWRKCPQAIFLPVRFDLYAKVSEQIMALLKSFIEPAGKFEQVSIDEAYLDISFLKSYQKAESLARKIKNEIKKKEKLTCSIGIGPNKLIAKIASDFQKPDGLTVIKPEKVMSFLLPMDVDVLYGVGPKTAGILYQMGVRTVRDLQKISKKRLVEIFGVFGEDLYKMARGIDEREVEEYWEIKSIGRQITFLEDTRDRGLITKTLLQLAHDVWRELKEQKFLFRTVTVTCRYFDFETHDKSETLPKPTDSFQKLKILSLKLILPFLVGKKKKVRLVGVRVSNLVK